MSPIFTLTIRSPADHDRAYDSSCSKPTHRLGEANPSPFRNFGAGGRAVIFHSGAACDALIDRKYAFDTVCRALMWAVMQRTSTCPEIAAVDLPYKSTSRTK